MVDISTRTRKFLTRVLGECPKGSLAKQGVRHLCELSRRSVDGCRFWSADVPLWPAHLVRVDLQQQVLDHRCPSPPRKILICGLFPAAETALRSLLQLDNLLQRLDVFIVDLQLLLPLRLRRLRRLLQLLP